MPHNTGGDPTPELATPGLVPYLFGLAGARELAGTTLVGLLGDLGLSQSSARSLIARLRSEGGLSSRAVGRRALYRLDGDMAVTFDRIAAGTPEDSWDGDFHGVLFTVPEADRGFRDRLRRILDHAGYGQLRAGLMIHSRERWERVRTVVGEVPAGATVYPVRLRLGPVDARSAARDAWNLDELAGRMHEQIEVLRRAAASVPADGENPLTTLGAVVRPALYLMLIDPRLPTPLRPPGWPARELESALADLHARAWPVLGPHLDRRLGQA